MRLMQSVVPTTLQLPKRIIFVSDSFSLQPVTKITIASNVSCMTLFSNSQTRSNHSVSAEICSAAKWRVSQATATH